jgi:DnaK suppressor protein
MATKTKETNESVPKTKKTAQNVPVAKKSGGTPEKVISPAKKVTPKEAVNISTPVANSKSISSPSSVKQEAAAKTPVKPAKKTDSKAKSPDEQPAPQASAAATQDQKWQEIRVILEKLKEDTIREIKKSVKIGTEAVAAIEPGGDIYDQASSERDRELGLLLGDREREKIHNIDEALLRIDEGDYGICEECDEDIPLGRLKAMPFTRHCVKCKSDLEKLQAQTKRVEEERAYREIPLGAEEEDS